ncbi:glycosyltransferase [Pedobacter psychrodurus]|uniref:Peptide O-xylosyltransferase n=1 Tax=Pedobacter psychrodurus TaxID=2530456 RepID=A0A4R0PTT3_9SPHI|nr:beta-1,6-N-acetylglucosaminyltransferase [Pedobacter psychrodurus]TCD23407.1 glycosyltransferase [Pedobacter psychrodurus]
MRVANIIMAYKNPKQLGMMIKAMAHPEFDFYIHLDKKIAISGFQHLQDLPNVYFIINRTVCNWGGFQFVQAILRSLEEILQKRIAYDFYNLLSAQDYPIKPVGIIADFFRQNIGKSFVSYDTEGNEKWWSHARSRFESYHFTDFNFKGKYLLQRVINNILPKRKFPLPAKLYGACISSWWSISSACAVYLTSYIKEEQGLMRFMKYTWAADEFFIATLLMDSPYKNTIVNDNLRMITWDENLPNPLILKSVDFAGIRSSEKLFARKFDIDIDAKILSQIDENLLINIQ